MIDETTTAIATAINDIKNKGFTSFDELCHLHGWHRVVNEPTHLCYTKHGDETTTVRIEVTATKIHVSVPLKNSVYQYQTSFGTYFDACEYLEQRFKDFLLLP